MEKHNMTESQKQRVESYMYGMMISLGIDRSLIGTKYIGKMIIDKVEVDNLSKRELKQVIEVWESRHIPSTQREDYEYLDQFPHLEREDNETEESFLRRYVKLIQKCVQTFH